MYAQRPSLVVLLTPLAALGRLATLASLVVLAGCGARSSLSTADEGDDWWTTNTHEPEAPPPAFDGPPDENGAESPGDETLGASNRVPRESNGIDARDTNDVGEGTSADPVAALPAAASPATTPPNAPLPGDPVPMDLPLDAQPLDAPQLDEAPSEVPSGPELPPDVSEAPSQSDTTPHEPAPDDVVPGEPLDPVIQMPALPAPEPAQLVGLAFDVELLLDTESRRCIGHCQPATLIIEAVDEDGLHVLWGATRSAQRTTLLQVDGAWELSGAITLGQHWSQAGENDNTRLTSALFQFGIEDDGSISLFATGTANSRSYGGHNGHGEEFSISLRGTPDARWPAAPWPTEPIPATVPLYLSLDKPLQPGAGARLVSDAGELIELSADVMEGFTVGFFTSRVLALGTDYLVEFDGVDFANVGVPAPGTVVTEPSFGVIEDPSFESSSVEGVLGATLTAVSLPSDAPPDGMLYAPPGVRVVLRLAAEPTATEVRFDARIATPCNIESNFGAGMTFHVLVTGQDHEAVAPVAVSVSESLSELAIDDEVVSVDATAEEVVIPLGSTASDDVLLTFQGSTSSLHGCVISGAFVDNVRLQ